MNSAIPKIYMVTGIHVNKMWRDDQGGAFINFPVLRLKNIYMYIVDDDRDFKSFPMIFDK